MVKLTAKGRKKLKLAVIYVIAGLAVIFIAIMCILYMYFSGTFLAYKYVLRKILYCLLFLIIFAASWFVNQGTKYISKVISKKRH